MREQYRRKFPSYRCQREHILDWFQNNQPNPGEFVYSVCGIRTCYKAFITALGIPRSTFFSWKSDFLKGRVNPEHGTALTLKRSDISDAVLFFLKMYFEENCDFLPTGDVWHLPSSSSKVDIFKEMNECFRRQGQFTCSLTYFTSMWKQFFPYVKIPKVINWWDSQLCYESIYYLKCDITNDCTLREKIFKIRILYKAMSNSFNRLTDLANVILAVISRRTFKTYDAPEEPLYMKEELNTENL